MSEIVKLEADMNEVPTNVTWQPGSDAIRVRLMNDEVDLTLDLGDDVVRQLRQALSWVSLRRVDAIKRYTAKAG